MLLIVLVAIGCSAYWILKVRRSASGHVSLAAEVAVLSDQVRALRESQWQMRTAVDALREEQDFSNQLRDPKG